MATLREYMESSETTQEEVASRLGVTRQAVSLYLLGHTTPGLDVALKMRDLLGVELETWSRRKAR